MTMDFYTLKSVIRCLSFNIATVKKPNSMNEDWNNDSNEEIIMTLCSRNISITSVCDNYQIGYQSETSNSLALLDIFVSILVTR